MFNFFAALVCKNCSQPIPLPSPTHPGRPLDRPLWPRDAQTRNFLCPQCKQVFAYSAQDAHWLSSGDMAPSPFRKRYSVVCIEVSCGTPNCEAPIKIHTPMACDADIPKESRRLVALSSVQLLGCGAAHFLKGSLHNAMVLRAYFDQDWQVR